MSIQDLSIADLMDELSDSYQAAGRAPRTISYQRDCWLDLARFHHPADLKGEVTGLDEVTTRNIERWTAAQRSKGLRSITIASRWTVGRPEPETDEEFGACESQHPTPCGVTGASAGRL